MSPMPVQWENPTFSDRCWGVVIVKFLTWTAKDAYQLAATPAIIRDGDDIAQCGVVSFSHLIEEINEIVRGTATRKHDNAIAGGWQGSARAAAAVAVALDRTEGLRREVQSALPAIGCEVVGL